ncbi:alanyl-tRNA editing protein [Mitsuokella sp. AF33-22]|uniref:alanyl-tRNA editing protein n=1 Tax=Mitsuokella sp. AF33-22 TaxID=2292047 RepID=UPI001F2E5AA3|nr:alanyl-tRNA editing protein [Mitsuokella sp. AF33-22]
MKTKKLFEENVMLQSCEATVQACEPAKDGYRIVLDQTVFFPEGGGQLSDRGVLRNGRDAIEVLHASERDGIIYHETKQPLAAGTLVTCQLNWQERFDHMQQHCGEHMLSYAFWKLYGADNVGFHMHPDMVSIDISREVDYEEAMAAEAMTNRAIEEDRPIHVELVPAEHAAKRPLRKFNDKLKGILRIVSVEGNDSCTCCGTHPPTTGMVGLVKVLKVERHKGGSRISFLCGREALQKMDVWMRAAQDVSNRLSVKEEEIAAGVERLEEEKKALGVQVTALTDRLLDYELREMDAKPVFDQAGHRKLVFIREDLTPSQAKALARKALEREHAVVAVFYRNGARINYILSAASDDVNCQQKLKEVNDRFKGRGGGRPDACQGSAACVEGWQQMAADLAAAW